MAGFQTHAYFNRPSHLSIDTHPQSIFDEDSQSILDENILDGSAIDSGLEMSPASRRESYAIPMTSVKSEGLYSNSNNPYLMENHNNPFTNNIHANSFAQQAQNQWPMNTSGTCTPMATAFDTMPQQFQAPHIQNAFNTHQQSIFSPATTVLDSMPASPQKEWSQPETVNIEHRGMPKRMRQNSPPLRTHEPMMRRDGIRKKNARFEIPAERNLMNIDHLIAQSTDEQEIKELKQQKRLLRNRQAALDSRQRKKQHTERLEDEKKHYTQFVADLEEELADMRIRSDEQDRKEQQYIQMIQNLQMEKEELVRMHTLETGDLRKKVSVLTEHVQKLEMEAATPVPAQPCTNDFSDFESLTIDGAWDGISFLNDFPETEVKTESSTALVRKELGDLSSGDKPAGQGLLLMLLLFGAYVASKGASPSLPTMSDDVRAASATILEDIITEAGVSATTASFLSQSSAPAGVESWSSGIPSAHVNMAQLSHNGFAPSILGDFADSLTQPTQEQEHEQLFGMSAAQYNAVNEQHFGHSQPVKSTSTGRRNLAESLAAMRSTSGKKTDVYTRSLLWDQVPQDVVRQFAKMVEGYEAGGGNSDPNTLG